MIKKRIFHIIFIIFVLLLLPANLLASQIGIEEKPIKVLLLNSYDQEMNWVKGLTRGVLDSFQSDKNEYSVHIENMDTKYFSSKKYYEVYSLYLKEKYKDSNISLILATDNNAYDFLREQRDSLFPTIPVVFCGVNDFNPKQLEGLRNFTGVEERITITETMELIGKFHPETTEIYIINDFLKTGRAWAANIQKTLMDYPSKIKIRYSNDLTLPELQKEVSQLSPTSVVLLGVYFADKNGLSSTYEAMGMALAKHSKVPVYCLAEFNINKGVVGGVVISGYAEGSAIAIIGKEILNGMDPNSIPVDATGSNRGIFNYNQLKRFDIKESMLPEGSIVKFRKLSLYSEYKGRIWAVISMIIVLLITILFLVRNIRIKNKIGLELKESVGRFRQLYQQAPVMLLTIDKEERITQVNDLWLKTLGYSRDEVIGKFSGELIAADSTKQFGDYIKNLYAIGFLRDLPLQFIRKDGAIVDVLLTAHLIINSEGQVQGARAALLDRTEQNKVQAEKEHLELQLVQSQKLESIGRLAGGVAHDLNNLLSPILGYCEILKLDAGLPKNYMFQLEQITKAGYGARDLVKQLLAFSRKQTLEFTSVNINNILNDFKNLLRQTIPESITITWILSEDIEMINADVGQIEQVIMNLVINAADSMTDGGQLTVETSRATLDENIYNSHQDVVPGEYILISFSDTGCGMDSKTVEKIFEPFFSTKGDMGTGLGLATVYGIVKQHNGTIWVYSEPDIGTTFKVYLPVSDQIISEHSKQPDVHKDLFGNENILLVEDNKQVRDVAQTILEKYGYNVVSVESGEKAFAAVSEAEQGMDLLLTDVVMPEMNGKELYNELSKKNSNLKVVYMSGYTNDIIARHGIIDEGILFIQKPFTTLTLSEKVREALDL